MLKQYSAGQQASVRVSMNRAPTTVTGEIFSVKEIGQDLQQVVIYGTNTAGTVCKAVVYNDNETLTLLSQPQTA